MQSPPADNQVKEEHLLNLVVNSLDEELSLFLGDNVEITAEKLYEVPPVPASAEPQSSLSRPEFVSCCFFRRDREFLSSR